MSLRFFSLLASEEFDNTAKYSPGRVLLGAQQDSGLKKEEERHIIKEEKAEIGGKNVHLMQEFKHRSTMEGKGEEASLSSIPEEELETVKMRWE